MNGSGMSGFPEWLPEQQLVEEHVLRIVRQEFELHGFTPMRTRSVERLDHLVAQGETDKEIYAISRIGAPSEDTEPSLGLHYDLTVPFARFVAENRGRLTFPFRRYQVQPAWRGERPQLGRYREFLQADADVIVERELAVRYDAEMIALLHSTIRKLPVPRVRLLVNNRKLLEGYYRSLGIHDVTGTLRIVDKLSKVGPHRVVELLMQMGLAAAQAEGCVQLAQLEVESVAELERMLPQSVGHPLFEEGIKELSAVLAHCHRTAGPGDVVAALHIARGFDYYTGTVVEGVFADHRDLGAVCSGGRYDNLASRDPNSPRLPGVGVSLGITRMLAYAFHLGLIKPPRKSPAVVLVAVHSDDDRAQSEAVATTLRARGISCLISDSAAAYGKQLRFAARLGIPYVWFPSVEGRPHEVKDLVAGAQAPQDLDTWAPPTERTALRLA